MNIFKHLLARNVVILSSLKLYCKVRILFDILNYELCIMNYTLKINPLEIIEKYYSKGSEIHYILLKHSEQVRDKALKIAFNHPELKLNSEFIAGASMLHDIGIFLCDAPRIHCHGSHEYIQHGYLGADLLQAEGLPKHALVCERHTGVGLSLEMIQKKQLPLPQRDMLPVSLEEQAICYADKFFSKTQLEEEHSIERIRQYLNRYGESEVLKFDEWNSMFEGEKL